MDKNTELIVCPICLNKLRPDKQILICGNPTCKVEYQIINNIPNLLVEEANIKCPCCNEKREWNNIEKILYCKNCNLYVKRNSNS